MKTQLLKLELGFGTIIQVLALLLSIGSISGCDASRAINGNDSVEKSAPKKQQGEPSAEESEEDAFLAALTDPNDPTLYIIRPGDKIRIKVFDEDELNGEHTVDSAGIIILELIESVKIGGLTVKAAKEHIHSKYETDYLFEPKITLSVIEKAKRRFVILGQVQSPGYYSVPRSIKLDIFQAIAMAGGYTRLAGKVTIKRTTSRGETSKKFRLSRLKKKPKSEVPLVAENDTIIVGESWF